MTRILLWILTITAMVIILAIVMSNAISQLIDIAIASGSGLWIATVMGGGFVVLALGYAARRGFRAVDDDLLDQDARRTEE